MKIIIQQQNFDINKEIKLIKQNNNIGACVLFIGFVRDLYGNDLNALEIEHYPQMSENSLQKIADNAKKRWQIDDITIIHRIGKLIVSDKIVLVITSSKHRQDAFSGCEFIMDYLKTDAPFWKKEYTKNGNKWVTTTANDKYRKKKWS